MSIKMRPRFRMSVSAPAEEAMDRLRATLERADGPCYIDAYERQFEIRMRREHHHFWSPELNLIFRDDEAQSVLEGRFGPGAHVWTFFMAGYATFGMIGLGGAILALSQMTIDEPATGGWVILAGFLGCVLVYVAAQIGQRLAGPQIAVIRDLIHETFPDDEER